MTKRKAQPKKRRQPYEASDIDAAKVYELCHRFHETSREYWGDAVSTATIAMTLTALAMATGGLVAVVSRRDRRAMEAAVQAGYGQGLDLYKMVKPILKFEDEHGPAQGSA